MTQAALADFIDGGHFARHVRRTRALYAERQAALVRAVRRTLGGLLEVTPAEAGMHLVGWLPPASTTAPPPAPRSATTSTRRRCRPSAPGPPGRGSAAG